MRRFIIRATNRSEINYLKKEISIHLIMLSNVYPHSDLYLDINPNQGTS